MIEQNKIYTENCLETMCRMPDNFLDSIVTDPPYGLKFMSKKWDADVPDIKIWQECLRVLKPGGYLLAFAGTRTQHRMAVRIEDAGFEIRDMIAWVYGSGFPKSHNIGKAVDKLQGNKRNEVGNYIAPDGKKRTRGEVKNAYNHGLSVGVNDKITIGTSEWEGWGTALKPALEPITVARKPFKGTVAENVLQWGTGGMNIEQCRVGTGQKRDARKNNTSWGIDRIGESNNIRGNKAVGITTQGRFPANLIHDNSEEVKACFPKTKTGNINPYVQKIRNGICYGTQPEIRHVNHIGDLGSASRYFKSIIYQPKAGKKERGSSNNHPTVKPVALIKYLVKLVTRPGGLVYDPFGGSGTLKLAATELGVNYILSEIEKEYAAIAEARNL